MSTHRMALRVLVMVAVLSLAIVPTASAAVCPGGPGPTCIELRVKNGPTTPVFTNGATTQLWPNPGVSGCLPDVTPNWAGPLVTVDSTAPVAPPIQLCANFGEAWPGSGKWGGNLWVSSGRDVGAMAGKKWINDLENVGFNVNHAATGGIIPNNMDFDWVSLEIECQGPATRQHVVQIYYYDEPQTLVEQQLITAHGSPGVNSFILDTSPGNQSWFHKIEIEPQLGAACDIVNVNGFGLVAH